MDRDNLYYASVDGVLYSKDLNTIIRFPINKDVAKYKIPTSVTTIGDASFSDCKFLKNVDIPDSVTIIGHQAFEWCEFLQDLKALFPIISTLFGISILLRDSQYAKAKSPITFTLLGISIV